jgi:hypothetical protein
MVWGRRTIMIKYILAVLAVVSATALPASAVDTSSLSAFAASCSSDAKGCRSVTLSTIMSARSANYGCIPKDTANDTASDKLLDWLRGTAARDPKYANESLADLMWTGIDEVWPCKK